MAARRLFDRRMRSPFIKFYAYVDINKRNYLRQRLHRSSRGGTTASATEPIDRGRVTNAGLRCDLDVYRTNHFDSLFESALTRQIKQRHFKRVITVIRVHWTEA